VGNVMPITKIHIVGAPGCRPFSRGRLRLA
jgi:hypothetical protein